MLKILLFALFILTSVFPAHSEEYIGKVVAIADGDTLTLLTSSKRQVKVRLAEIDTPESGQPYGGLARDALGVLAFDKHAQVEVIGHDQFGRVVGRVFVGNTNVNAALVQQGVAWVYRQYSKDPALLALEEEARKAERGLWQLPEAQLVPPWEWRQAARQAKQQHIARSTAAALSGGSFSCDEKRYCKQMSSCAEARLYLEQCRLPQLDSDGDGVPCESLC